MSYVYHYKRYNENGKDDNQDGPKFIHFQKKFNV
jgi:hypothetical protein